jgi:hypothetical protein
MSSRRSNHVVRRRFFGPLDIIPMQAGKDRHRRPPMSMLTIAEINRRLLSRHAGSR